MKGFALFLRFLKLGLFCRNVVDLSSALDICRALILATKTLSREEIGRLGKVGCWVISDCIFQISDWGRCVGDFVAVFL